MPFHRVIMIALAGVLCAAPASTHAWAATTRMVIQSHPDLGGRCLDVPNARFLTGMRLQMWTCNNTIAQTFVYDDAKQLLMIGDWCVESWGRGDPQDAVGLGGCSGQASQHWKLVESGNFRQFVGINGQCLELRSAFKDNGAPLDIAGCDAGRPQLLWVVREIRDAPAAQALSAAAEAALKGKDSFKECADCPEMVVVAPGSFLMGSPEAERAPIDEAYARYKAQYSNFQVIPLGPEGPQHIVWTARTVAVGKFPVTFEEWDACVNDGGCNGYRPSDQGWGRGRRPVVNVNWDDARAYVAWLSRKTGKSYRLLSEAEWEYMARAGTQTPFWWGTSFSTAQANYNGSFTYGDQPTGENQKMTLPVDSFAANPWGIQQVGGNSYDWVEDCFHDSYDGAPIDGSAWTSDGCKVRVLRGGAWSSAPWVLRSAYRARFPADFRSSNHGFRVARALAH